jgi:hypothetical protein
MPGLLSCKFDVDVVGDCLELRSRYHEIQVSGLAPCYWKVVGLPQLEQPRPIATVTCILCLCRKHMTKETFHALAGAPALNTAATSDNCIGLPLLPSEEKADWKPLLQAWHHKTPACYNCSNNL